MNNIKQNDIMINGKVLYTTKGAANEYGRVGANFYTGCPHNCTYCYLKRGVIGKALGGTEVKLKKSLKDPETALDIFIRELYNHISHCRETGVFFSFTTDPLIPETRMLTGKAMMVCVDAGVPVWVLTKDSEFVYDLEFWEPISGLPAEKRDLVHWGFTLTGRDDMEPNASWNTSRIETMKELHKYGWHTFASIEPVIDVESSTDVIRESIDGCDHYKIGLRSGVKKDYYNYDELCHFIRTAVDFITLFRGRTVYLKQSVRKMLDEHFPKDQLPALLSKTVDMDGKTIKIQ